jgi:hypothetical protein
MEARSIAQSRTAGSTVTINLTASEGDYDVPLLHIAALA